MKVLKQKPWQFTQAEAATRWNIYVNAEGETDATKIPYGAKDYVVTHIKATGGVILQPDDQTVAPDGLQLDFGVVPTAGIAYLTYYIEEEENDTSTTLTTGANSVTISVVQNGGTPEGSSF